MKLTQFLSSLAAAAVLSCATMGVASAQETPAPAAPAPAAEAPAAPAAETPKPAEPAPAAAAAPAGDPAKPEPTLEQRIGAVEAYIGNTDPTVPLKTAKDKDGNPSVPEGLTTSVIGIAGPGHNGWMMTSAALVLF